MKQYFGVKKENDTIYLDENDYNHIKNVMRCKANDKIEVIYDNTRYFCTLNNDLKTVNIIDKEERVSTNNVITAYIPITDNNKISFVLQKGTEMGVDVFYIVNFKHSKFVIKDKENKLKRFNEIVRNASMQSKRLTIPKVIDIIDVKNIEVCNNVNLLCSLDKNNVKPLNTILTKDNVSDTINIVYGPEGGISKDEEDFLILLGYKAASLGKNVLRTETVLINVMSIINYLKE